MIQNKYNSKTALVKAMQEEMKHGLRQIAITIETDDGGKDVYVFSRPVGYSSQEVAYEQK